jgi:hypothetical protein
MLVINEMSYKGIRVNVIPQGQSHHSRLSCKIYVYINQYQFIVLFRVTLKLNIIKTINLMYYFYIFQSMFGIFKFHFSNQFVFRHNLG